MIAFGNVGNVASMKRLLSVVGCVDVRTERHVLEAVVGVSLVEAIGDRDRFAKWVWRCNKSEVRCIVRGLQGSATDKAIWTACATFRDEVMRLLLHGGWSPIFSRDDQSGRYCIEFAEDTERDVALPVADRQREGIRGQQATGRVWCLTMPSGLVWVRRVHKDARGVVCEASRAVVTGNCGSPNYAAPEVISGQMYSGQEIDIWSCGVILYALVVGKLPFDEDYIPTLFQKIRGGIYHVPSFVPAPCTDLIGRLLDVNPISRITVAEVKRHPWFVVNLPQYLNEVSMVDHKSTTRIQNVNPAIVQMILQKCGGTVTEEFVRQKLQSDQTNDIIVAYHLLLDTNPHLRVSSSAGNMAAMHTVESADALDAIKHFATSPPMNLRDQEVLIPTPAGFSSHSFTPNFTPPRFVADNDDDEFGGSRSLGSSRPMKAVSSPPGNNGVPPAMPSNSWYLGVLTEKNPEAVMNECYRVLRLCEFEWKAVTKFNVRVRPVVRRKRAMSMQKKRRSVFGTRERTPDGREDNSNDNVKFELAVYRVNANQCLVDFKRLSDEGTTTGFIMTCNLLISVLSLK